MPLHYPLVPVRKAPAATPPPAERRRVLGMLRLTISGTVVLTLAGMVARVFFVDSFGIPTASMEPTIVGHPEQGDRVILSRLSYLAGEPGRWDVILFRYPNNRGVRYMKRIVGLGGEQLLIAGGDLYVADPAFTGTLAEGLAAGRVAILRKPRPVQDALLERLAVLSPAETAGFEGEGFHRLFAVDPEDVFSFIADGQDVRVTSVGRRLARTRREARDFAYDPLHDRSPGGGAVVVPGRHAVGDLSFRLDVTPASESGRVILEIQDAAHDAPIEARVAIGGGESEIRVGDRVLARFPFALARGRRVRLRLDNVDDRVSLFADGEVLAERDYGHAPPGEGPQDPGGGRATAAFGAEDGALLARRPELFRDVYYVETGETRFLIPEGHYLCLGDNSPSSADSRLWRRSAIQDLRTGEVLFGDADGITLRRMQGPGENPWQEPDGTWVFCDLLGNLRPFPDAGAFRALGTWPTPYVPRALVLGRGALVIAPLDRAHWLR